jgi:hypothetical protein
MSDGDFLDGYREALDLMKDEFTAARARVKELEGTLRLIAGGICGTPGIYEGETLIPWPKVAERVLRGEEER